MTDTIETNGQAVTQTIAEWLEGLTPGTVIKNGRYGWEYIWTGLRNDSHAHLAGYADGNYGYMGIDGPVGDWATVGDDVLVIVPDTHLAAVRFMVQERLIRERLSKEHTESIEALRHSLNEELTELRQRNASQQADWDKLNELLGQFAVDKQYCPEYEDVIAQWNEDFNTCQLVGRVYNWDVPVRIVVEVNSTVSLQGRTPEAVRDLVDDVIADRDEILSKAGFESLGNLAYADINIEVNGDPGRRGDPVSS